MIVVQHADAVLTKRRRSLKHHAMRSGDRRKANMTSFSFPALARRALHMFRRAVPRTIGELRIGDAVELSQLQSMHDAARYRNGDQLDLPDFTLEVVLNHMQCFTSPNPDRIATVMSAAGDQVGYITYAVSPLFDKLYIFQINIDDAFRRQRYGLAIIHYLHSTYQLPIATFNEVGAARRFWAAARHMVASLGSSITAMSVGEMTRERARWKHLQPETDRLEQLISQRFLAGEDYQSAVGRGLE